MPHGITDPSQRTSKDAAAPYTPSPAPPGRLQGPLQRSLHEWSAQEEQESLRFPSKDLQELLSFAAPLQVSFFVGGDQVG